MHLSQKQKGLSQLYYAFSKSTLNFEYFQKKMFLIGYVYQKLWTPKDLLRQMSKNSRLRGPLARQHGKQVETPIQSERQQFYHID